MGEINFSIVRKMTKPAPKAAGLALRSMDGGPEAASAVLLDLSGYNSVKENIAASRLRHAGAVSYKTRGKSLEIHTQAVELPEGRFDALQAIFEILDECSFNTEDVLDVMEFGRACLSGGFVPALKARKIELSTDFFNIELSADIVEGQSPEAIYSVLDPICTKCGMGIIKERQDELS